MRDGLRNNKIMIAGLSALVVLMGSALAEYLNPACNTREKIALAEQEIESIFATVGTVVELRDPQSGTVTRVTITAPAWDKIEQATKPLTYLSVLEWSWVFLLDRIRELSRAVRGQ